MINKKVLFVSSKGGHFAELLELKKTITSFNSVVVTEKGVENSLIDYHLTSGSRDNSLQYLVVFLKNNFETYKILKKERPHIIISTGAHSAVHFYFYAKLFKAKTIYIESFARRTSKSLTYKLINKFCDVVIVQHKTMLDVEKNAKYWGSLF